MDINTFYNKYFTPGNVSTDSRTVRQGDIFIALRGENFNGNKYTESALKSGAKVAVIDDPDYKEINDTIFVQDCLTFLQELAIFHRQKCDGHFIGLTGSNGKTTTKELIHAVLSEKYSCQATLENLNNHIGVPLTILSIRYETEIAVIEMGANHTGEIDNLCKICQPDSGLITNIGKAHLEGFGNLEGVKKAKAELFNYLKKNHRKIYINGSDDMLLGLIGKHDNVVQYNNLSGSCNGKILVSENTVKLNISFHENTVTVETNLHGDYNINNILAAACIGLDFNLSLEQIKAGLEKYKPINKRSQLINLGSTKLLLDCYNANPTSMNEALNSFLKIPSKKKIVILGEMKELGEFSVEEHKNIGILLRNAALDHIFLIGKEFDVVKIEDATNMTNVHELRKYLSGLNLQNTSILVKGSRANRLELVYDFIVQNQSESN